MAVVVISGGGPVPLNITSSPQQLADANVQSTIINPSVDAAGNPAKLSFFGGVPVAQPVPTGNTHTPTAGSGTQVYTNTTFDGGVGTSAYTIGDLVTALKDLNLIQISPGGFVAPSPPVLTGNPSISDPNPSPAVGDVMTATHGTYTGVVTSYNGQWYSGAVATGQTGLTYTVQSGDAGKNIVYAEFASNIGGNSATGTSNSLGPIIAASLATPTLAIQSALGTAPLVLQWSDTDDVIGLYAQLEIDQTSNAFSNITQNLVFFVDGGSYALNSENIGLITPSGTYWARLRTCRDNDSGAATVTGTDPQGNAISFSADVSGWSNVVTDTINVSSATFATSGISPYLTLSNSNKTVAQNNASVGAPCLDRASIHNQNAKFTVEFTVADLYNGTGTRGIYFGVCDSTPSFSSPGYNTNAPGNSTGPVPGLSCSLKMGDTSLTVLANGVSTTPALGGTVAATDVFHVEVDTTADKFDIWYIPLGTGTAVHLTGSPFTLTGSYIPATWFAFGGGQKGNGTIGGNASDAVTANFGASPWARTPTSGFGIYG